MAGRRGNGEGTIRKRTDGRWEARLSLPDGTSKAFYAKTRAEVAERLAQARHDQRQGVPPTSGRQSVGQYLTSWYETVQPQVRPSTYRRYGDYTRHLKAGLVRQPLTQLNPQQVQQFYAKKMADGLSPTTVYNIHGMLHRALDDALRMGLLSRNVTELVRPPRKATREMRTLSPEEVRRFLSVVRGDRFEALYVLALSTGMREGELLGLRWQDLDLDRAVLRVRLNVAETATRYVLAEVKTAYSRRSIGLIPAAVEALRQHQERQQAQRQRLGDAYDASLDLVFPNRTGGVMIPDNLAKRSFKQHLEAAGLPRSIRLHDFRHTAATLLLGAGVNVKVVSEMLGHADVGITLRVYAHVLPHMQQSAMTAMAGLIGESPALPPGE